MTDYSTHTPQWLHDVATRLSDQERAWMDNRIRILWSKQLAGTATQAEIATRIALEHQLVVGYRGAR